MIHISQGLNKKFQDWMRAQSLGNLMYESSISPGQFREISSGNSRKITNFGKKFVKVEKIFRKFYIKFEESL